MIWMWFGVVWGVSTDPNKSVTKLSQKVLPSCLSFCLSLYILPDPLWSIIGRCRLQDEGLQVTISNLQYGS